MSKKDEGWLNLVNASGFPFQIRVEQEIESQNNEHRWKMVGGEHRWYNSESDQEGFIDIVLLNDSSQIRMAIECKRVRNDGDWIFLVLKDDKINKARARALWSLTTKDENIYMDWSQLSFHPTSLESSFFLVQGQNSTDGTMLERLADKLLPALESLATQELGLQRRNVQNGVFPFFYVPVIATNAKLQVCSFDPKSIDLLSGELQLSEVGFETVPFIRFKKGLTTSIQPSKPLNSLQEVNTEGQRTMFVVNVEHLTDFLKNFNRNSEVTMPPWDALHQRKPYTASG